MKVLLTLGRLPKALELARAFAGAGCEVTVAEPFAWHLCRVSRDVRRCARLPAPNDGEEVFHDALLELADRAGIDLIVPVSDETMHVGAINGRLSRGRTRLFCPPQAQLLTLHDKLAFIELAASFGLPVPATRALGDGSLEPARELIGAKRCISKPRFSSAGKGLVQYPAGSRLDWPDDAAPAVLQEYLPGAELSTFGIVRDGRLVANVVYHGCIMSGTVAVCFERLTEYPRELDDWVREFARATGHDGFLSFDFRLDADGRPLPMECNPRATSGIHFLTPQSLARAVLSSAEELEEFTPEFRDELRLQMFYPALTEVQSAALRRRPVPGGLKLLARTRDVTWEARDPLPLLLQPLVSMDILGRTITKGWTFGEASTFDIAWVR